MPNGIAYIDRIPVVAIDGEGVTISYGSGECTWTRRMPRSLYRKMLESNIRHLNEYEIAERMDRGRIVPFEKRG